MKKILLSFLIMSVLLVSVSGIVSAYTSVDTFSDGTYVTPQDVFNQGDTVYAKGWDGPANIRLVFKNPSDSVVETCSPNYGVTTCDLDLASNAPAGQWTVEVQYPDYYGWHTFGSEHFTVNEGDECANCKIKIEAPLAGYHYSTADGDILVDWTATDCATSAYRVYYTPRNGWNNCEDILSEDWKLLAETDPDTDYFWNIEEFTEGEFCVKVSNLGCCETVFEGPFVIDNVDPTADANGETCYCEEEWCMPGCQEPDCNDCGCCESNCVEGIYTCYEGSTITLDGSGSVDNGDFPSYPLTYSWVVDGEFVGTSESQKYFCADGTQDLDVELTVTDDVGNSNTDDESIIHVINVAPTCNISPSELQVPLMDGGAEVTLTGNAYDVDADIPKMLYSWDFEGDSANEIVESTSNSATYTYDTAGVYTVTLTVDDTDGGVGTCTAEVEVKDIHEKADQEVAAFYPLEADFGEEVLIGFPLLPNQFYHGEINGGACTVVQGPDNLKVGSDGGYACTVYWSKDAVTPYFSGTANPTNAERGSNNVIIKVDNGTDVEYYSFDVMVYSWIIPLNEQWNLMSIPLTAEDSKPGMVFNGGSDTPVDQVWSYEYDADTGESEWQCVEPTSLTGSGSSCGSGITKLASIEPGKAYWVKLKDVENPAVVKGFGFSPDEVQGGPMLPPSVDVPTNAWSLIGRYGIVGMPWDYHGDDNDRVHGALYEDIALDSLTWLDHQNDMHVYDEDFTIKHDLSNNEGYWLWIETNVANAPASQPYSPIDSWYPENSGLSL